MRAAWITDIHLNFLNAEQVLAFCAALRAENPDLVLLGGDIAEADTVEWYLKTLTADIRLPMYFVLGNHDFYQGSIPTVRKVMDDLCRNESRLTYLSRIGCVKLTDTTGLVGHDGWGDGRLGDYAGSTVRLNDHRLIRELTGLDRDELLLRLNRLGDDAADHLRSVLPQALDAHERVILLTHVPPFIESCWHEGKTSDGNWAPFFTCKAVGDVLLEIMSKRPDRQLTVLCGHCHGAGRARMLSNLEILTGRAEYGAPEIQTVFEID
ncbi:MAG: metallophosphoesterase [Nitrospira sp.]|nr:metallophosphoesterase [Nitrospira sp.]